jgi:hypothetical protein
MRASFVPSWSFNDCSLLLMSDTKDADEAKGAALPTVEEADEAKPLPLRPSPATTVVAGDDVEAKVAPRGIAALRAAA